ncbi:MAG: ribonuclease activity regulator RraA [Hyphomicrobiales bacterium]
MSVSEICTALTQITTATITMQLLKRGIRRSHMRGPLPLMAGQTRIAGPAFTVRFIPGREDVSTLDSYAARNSLRDAIEAMPEGAIAVIDARGEMGAATIGDILALAMVKRGVAGFVSDGTVRDVEGVRASGLPVWSAGPAAPPPIGALYFADWELPIGCGGVAVFPDDIIVADEDGAVVIPAALAAEVAEDGAEQERFERFVLEEVRQDGRVKGRYPPDEETLARYREWVKRQG